MPPVYFVYLANLYLVGGMTLLKISFGVESEYPVLKDNLEYFIKVENVCFTLERTSVLKKTLN